uniref:AlNc14C19G2006 protein n=1 Tax=Albugo laibachii Nc14 TaxID=890382 RepID=F0W535_9STRA|nr:AlNc14C19G2006 [Albugo laibachii Nc14]|eukprot:CCA16226.1 AlNc14C19G2006 [Albugo laibachii Nc14]
MSRIWVGNVPSELCANEEQIREFFGVFGDIHSIQAHYNQADMTAPGFIFLEYKTKQEATSAVEAVNGNSLQFEGAANIKAAIAFDRDNQTKFDVDESLCDLLSGRTQLLLSNPLSQQSQSQFDDENLVLQSLSQRVSSRKKSKKRKRR